MNKIKKIFISFSAFITGLLTKIPVSLAVDPKYGVTLQDKYGVFDPTMEKNICLSVQILDSDYRYKI